MVVDVLLVEDEQSKLCSDMVSGRKEMLAAAENVANHADDLEVWFQGLWPTEEPDAAGEDVPNTVVENVTQLQVMRAVFRLRLHLCGGEVPNYIQCALELFATNAEVLSEEAGEDNNFDKRVAALQAIKALKIDAQVFEAKGERSWASVGKAIFDATYRLEQLLISDTTLGLVKTCLGFREDKRELDKASIESSCIKKLQPDTWQQTVEVCKSISKLPEGDALELNKMSMQELLDQIRLTWALVSTTDEWQKEFLPTSFCIELNAHVDCVIGYAEETLMEANSCFGRAVTLQTKFAIVEEEAKTWRFSNSTTSLLQDNPERDEQMKGYLDLQESLTETLPVLQAMGALPDTATKFSDLVSKASALSPKLASLLPQMRKRIVSVCLVELLLNPAGTPDLEGSVKKTMRLAESMQITRDKLDPMVQRQLDAGVKASASDAKGTQDKEA